jgi:hypothetical protein
MGSSPGFGSTPSNFPEGFALFRLAFATAPPVSWLNLATESNSPAHSSIGTPSPPPERELRLLVGTRFQGLFHSPPGVLFTFPSRYWFTIGHHGYLALEGGPPGFPRDSSCPVVLKNIGGSHAPFAYGTLTLYGGPFQEPSARSVVGNSLRAAAAPATESYNPGDA